MNERLQTIVLALICAVLFVLACLNQARAGIGPDVSVLPFVGWANFCERYPDECVAKDKNQKITVTDQVRRDLLEINKSTNHDFIYQDDEQNYGMPDWWEYPTKNGRGDCEDFALEKKRRLMAKGYPQSALRLALVRAAKKGQADHVVLVIDTTITPLILDINSDMLEWESSTRYKFLYVQSSVDPKEWVKW